MTKQFTPFNQVAMDVLARVGQNRDYTTTLPAFVQSMVTPYEVQAEEGVLSLTNASMRQLAGQRLNVPATIFRDDRLSNETKLAVLREAAQADPEREVIVRLGGSQIDAVLSQDYTFFDNATLVTALLQYQAQGQLPDDLQVMSHHLSPNGRSMDMRLVAPSWNFTIKNGREEPFLGNLIVRNNETGARSFSASPAITRHQCLNSTIGQSIFSVEHRFANTQDFLDQLGRGVQHISQFTAEMGEQMQHLHHIEVEAPMVLFRRLAEELGIPPRAVERAGDYFEAGAGRSAFGAIQAFAAGVQSLTPTEGRRQPNWEQRTRIEQDLWTTTQALLAMHADGQPIEDWYMHGDLAVQELCARYVEGYATQIEQAERIAAGIRELELN